MRILSLAALILFWFANQPAIADDIPSHFADSTITVDGKANDWPSLAGMILQDQNAAVAVANDDRFLYCTFRTTDIRWVRAIKMTGITLYVDIDGGKHKDFYLQFIGEPSPEQLRAIAPDRLEGDAPEKFRGRQEPPNDRGHNESQLMLYIKDRLSEKEIPLDGAQGPAAAFDTSLGFYTYEFRIPLEYGEPLDFGLGVKKDKKLGIGLVWGDMNGMMKQNLPEGGFGGRSGGDGGFPGGGMEPGGGMRGGRGGSPEGSRGERPSKQEVWFKTKLAKAIN